MSVKEIKEAIEKEKIYFGIREFIKNKKKIKKVFVAKDSRPETFKIIEKEKANFEQTKSKEEISKELNLSFLCEVFSLK